MVNLTKEFKCVSIIARKEGFYMHKSNKRSTIINNLRLKKIKLLEQQALQNGDALPYSNEEFDKLRDVYHGNFPALIYIKYFSPFSPAQLGQCYERSLVISSIFEDAKLVCGYRKDFLIVYGKGSWHWWVESDGWCYEPSGRLKIRKDVYYRIYKPKVINELSKEEILQNGYYKSMVNKAPKNSMLVSELIALDYFARISNNEDFKNEVLMFEEKIKYTDANSYDMNVVLDTVNKMNESLRKTS